MARDTLATLFTARRLERERCEGALARATHELQAAVDEVSQARAALHAHSANSPNLTGTAERHVVRGSELARAGAYARKHAAIGAELRTQVDRCGRVVAERKATLARAKAELSRALANEQAAARAQEAHEQAVARRREHRAQEELDDQAAARIVAQRDRRL